MDISGWMTNQVTVTRLTGFDSTGRPSYVAGVVMPARIELSQKLVQDKNGAEVVSSHIVYTQAQIGIEDRLYLPGDNTGDPTVAKVPIRVDAANDRNGAVVYWKVTL